MKTQKIRQEKWMLIALYLVIVAVSAALIVLSVAGNIFNDFLVPFGIFVIMTAAESLFFHFSKNFAEAHAVILLNLILVKCCLVFMLELFSNYNFVNIVTLGFVNPRIALIIVFLLLVVADAALELSELHRIKKKGDLT